MIDASNVGVRVRTELVVKDHSGPVPRVVEIIEIITVNGRLFSRVSRRIEAEGESHADH